MILFGDAGNDLITGYYRGENDGAVSIRDFDGGAGNDIVRGLIQEDVGSTGVSAGIKSTAATGTTRCPVPEHPEPADRLACWTAGPGPTPGSLGAT